MSDVYSMTGYAQTQATCALGPVSVELRSVNSRFLDLNLRIPDELRSVEPALRDLLRSRVQRGKVECRVSLKNENSLLSGKTNSAALVNLKNLQEEVLRTLPEAAKLSVMEVLAYPGILATTEIDEEKLTEELTSVLETTLLAFEKSRAREGAALSAVLLNYCDTIDATVEELKPKLPLILEAMKEKMEERLKDALTAPLSTASGLTAEEINERIRTELTLYALKMDVDEEMNRLLTHTKEVRRILAKGGAVGKKLDFLMQELNREANTLGSKAASIEMTNVSLSLKLAIEQMREQIQNLG